MSTAFTDQSRLIDINYPADGATDVGPNAAFSWLASGNLCETSGITRFVFLSTDYDRVASGSLSTIVCITEANECCAEPLCLGATYYWRVAEAWGCGTVWGDVWSFKVVDCVAYEDMESYNEDDPNSYIWEMWLDGAGDQQGQGGNGTGSAVFISTDPDPLGDNKVMEYFYDSTGWEREYAFSEVNRPLDPPENFADSCEEVLVLWFYGDANNMTESMWVALRDDANDALSTYGALGPNSPNDIKTAEWKEWVIDLQEFADAGLDLENITEFSIGFGPRGRDGDYPSDPRGVVLFDEITIGTTICALSLDCLIVGDVVGDITVTQEMYDLWASVGKPQCWCYPCHSRGDADGDCDVDIDDVTRFREGWRDYSSPFRFCADTDNDGDVDTGDVTNLLDGWTNGCPDCEP
jgi:hypothetical protein